MQKTGSHLSIQCLDNIIIKNLSDKDLNLFFCHWRSCERCRKSLAEKRFLSSVFSESVRPAVIYEWMDPDASIRLLGSQNKILSVQFVSDDNSLPGQLRALDVPVINENIPEYLIETGYCFLEYFEKGQPLFLSEFSSFLIKSDFAKTVLFWTSLIPFGETTTYGEIARWMDKPRAARAVGGALHNNPLPILIPCHRVLGIRGQLTGFAGGLALKSRLLELEKYLPE